MFLSRIILWSVLIFNMVSSSTIDIEKAITNRCLNVKMSTFEHCSTSSDRKRYINRIINSEAIAEWIKTSNNSGRCSLEGPCRPAFRTARIWGQSLGVKISVYMAEILQRCCGDCAKYHETKLTWPLNTSLNSLLEKYDIIYPIYNTKSLQARTGFYFIPILDIPSAYYIAMHKSDNEVALQMIWACLDMWPLIVICLLMSFIAGFFIWILDTWLNKEQFPRGFLGGCLEGFWWSFISMTTVGYGDKAPKSIMARAFAVIWILVGITVFSIYVATLASDIIVSKNPDADRHEMRGKRVGMMKGRMSDALIIAEHGGIAVELEYNGTVTGILNMLTRLQATNETLRLDGLLVSRPTFYFFSRMIDEKKKRYRMPNVKLRIIEVSSERNDLGAGMLVRSYRDYKFFKGYFEINWAHIQGCYGFELNSRKMRLPDLRSNPMAGLFVPFLVGTLAILCGIVGFGVLYEIIRKRRQRRRKRRKNRELLKLEKELCGRI